MLLNRFAINSEKRQSSRFCCIANFLLKNKKKKTQNIIPIHLSEKTFWLKSIFFVFVIRTPFQSCSDLQQSITPTASKKKKKKIWRQLHWHDSCCWQWLNTFLTSWLSTHLCKFFHFFQICLCKTTSTPAVEIRHISMVERFTIFLNFIRNKIIRRCRCRWRFQSVFSSWTETLWNEHSLVCMQHLKQFENWIFFEMDFIFII